MLNDQLDEALAESQRARELNPDYGTTHAVDIARILIMLGRYDEAIHEIGNLKEINDRDYLTALLHRAPGNQSGRRFRFQTPRRRTQGRACHHPARRGLRGPRPA